MSVFMEIMKKNAAPGPHAGRFSCKGGFDGSARSPCRAVFLFIKKQYKHLIHRIYLHKIALIIRPSPNREGLSSGSEIIPRQLEINILSLNSVGTKSVFYMTQLHFSAGFIKEGNNIKPAVRFLPVFSGDIMPGRLHYPALFSPVNSSGGITESGRLPPSHLNKHYCPAITGDDIYLTHGTTVISL
jgi:hypothetical protein